MHAEFSQKFTILSEIEAKNFIEVSVGNLFRVGRDIYFLLTRMPTMLRPNRALGTYAHASWAILPLAILACWEKVPVFVVEPVHRELAHASAADAMLLETRGAAWRSRRTQAEIGRCERRA